MSNQKHILHIFKVMDRGGAEMRTLDIMRNIDRNKFKFHFCTLSDREGELDEDIISLGGIIHRCSLDYKFPVKFRKILKENKFDIIHSHVFMFSGYINKIASDYKIKTRISHLRSMGDGKRLTLRNRLSKRVFKFLLNRYSTNIISVSENTMNMAWSSDWERDPRCEVIYNGIDTTILEEYLEDSLLMGNLREELGIRHQDKMLVHVGRFNQAKNHEKLIKIFKEIVKIKPNVYLVLVGKRDGNFQNIKSLVQSLGLDEKVIFMGSRTDIYRFFLSADLMIFPSIREGLPGVVLEASATGLPIISSNISVIEELKEHLDNLNTLSLDLSNQNWAKHVLDNLAKTKKRDFCQSLINFQNSKFHINNAVNQITIIYDK